MDPLSWLGLRRRRDEHPNIQAVHTAVRALLPEDEPVVVRYIVIVAALLTRVARVDGRLVQGELDHLRQLFLHVERLPPDGVDAVCTSLNEHVPRMTPAEWELCYRELKSLCTASERRQVLRLLTRQAIADGAIAAQERGVLAEVAHELGIDEAGLAALEREILERQAQRGAPQANG